MANIIREVLNADQMPLFLFCGGMSKVGFGVTGTWTGTVAFYASNDGVNFNPVTVTPFASGTGVKSTTSTGNWELLVQNYVAVKVIFSRTTGSAVVAMAASQDSSYQDAFLASTSKFVNSVQTHATNTLTQASQANRAWRLRTLVITTVGTITWVSNPVIQIKDGTSLLWGLDIPTTAGVYNINLPADPNTPGVSGGGLVGTPGNAMSIVVPDGGASVITNINAEFIAA